MNNIDLQTNDREADERPLFGLERHSDALRGFDIDSDAIRGTSTSPGFSRATIAIIIAFWTIQYLGVTIMVLSGPSGGSSNLYLPRLGVTLVNVAISFAMVAIQRRLTGFNLTTRGLVALAMAILTPAISVLFNYVIFYYGFDLRQSGLPGAMELVSDYIMRLWIFGSLSGIILALFYAGDIREREQRIGALQQLAHSAQLRALRNQLNPHFLFNALNSVVALISSKRANEAETMTENLADFLRLTLGLEPQQLITLSEELRLQNLYLEIEQVRFPGRLQVSTDLPPELQSALVPSLITQPLIENTIKYAVARSTSAVDLAISARRDGDRLELVIADSGGDADRSPPKGAHFGLGNVSERLHLHFGDQGEFSAEPNPAGGFRNRLRLPLQFAQ